MTALPAPALRLALGLVDPAAADALAERLRPELLAHLGARFGLPAELVAELAGTDGGGLRAALAADPREFLLRAAETGDPRIARALWSARYRPTPEVVRRAKDDIPELLTVALRAADPADPRWYEEDGLVQVLQDDATGADLLAALTGRFPELIGYTLGVLGPYLPPPVVLDACLQLAGLGGPDAITELHGGLEGRADADPLGHPWLPATLKEAAAAPDPESFLRARRPAGEWTDPAHLRALVELRLGSGPLSRPDGLDWEPVLREHQRLPFGQETHRSPGFRHSQRLEVLIRWDGCPAELVTECFRTEPRWTARYADTLPLELLSGPEARPDQVYLPEVLDRGVRAGWLPADRLLTELSPAAEVLTALPYDHAPTRRAVGTLLAPLGTDPVNWLTLYARTGRARGTAAELVADALATVAAGKGSTTWPWRKDATFPATRPERSRTVFLELFRCAPEAARIAVVPHLDSRAVQHLMVFGDPTPAVEEAVVAAHGTEARVAQAAGGHHLPPERLTGLLELDEPAVDAALFAYAPLDRAERERLLAGRLRRGGTRPVPRALCSALDMTFLGHHRDRLMAGLESGDLGVARALVGRLRLRHPAARLRLLIAVWERGGPDAVREILAMDRLPATLRRQTTALLDAPDGLPRLQARLAAAEAPELLLAQLNASDAYDGELLPDRLAGEGVPLPWPALLAAQRAGTLAPHLPEALAQRPDCPREMLLALLGGTPSADTRWVQDALERGALTPEDLLTHCAPARTTLPHLIGTAESPAGPGDRCALRERVRALTAEHLGTDPETWAVCLQLLPTFAGTLPELITTAGALLQPAA
ncbi:hypothetical protein [Streptomyces sp. NPDC093097]|uniref:hypothetical protein n=1 Tax=Streptomyces sp. NPDC093097 TaxID=3366027 RepID=UPI0038288DB4